MFIDYKKNFFKNTKQRKKTKNKNNKNTKKI